MRLTTDILISAYAQGIFPMSVDDDEELAWFSPDPRTIIPLDDRFHISKSLARTLKKEPFQIRVNSAFETVLGACASAHGSTWISPEIHQAYMRMHHDGFAHSVECWDKEQLVGGLYGVAVGGAFCGESMFHYATDASKIALVNLVERLRSKGFQLLDAQWITPHLQKFGAVEIPRAHYLRRLRIALKHQPDFL